MKVINCPKGVIAEMVPFGCGVDFRKTDILYEPCILLNIALYPF